MFLAVLEGKRLHICSSQLFKVLSLDQPNVLGCGSGKSECHRAACGELGLPYETIHAMDRALLNGEHAVFDLTVWTGKVN